VAYLTSLSNPEHHMQNPLARRECVFRESGLATDRSKVLVTRTMESDAPRRHVTPRVYFAASSANVSLLLLPLAWCANNKRLWLDPSMALDLQYQRESASRH